MKRNDLSVFKMEKEGFKITLKKGIDFSPTGLAQVAPLASLQAAVPTLAADSAETTESASLREITSPMVGTFYASPSPESAPYVSVGMEVTEETVVCIIEAMKVMNEIKAEVRGVIAEVAAENGKPVQFGQPLFRLK